MDLKPKRNRALFINSAVELVQKRHLDADGECIAYTKTFGAQVPVSDRIISKGVDIDRLRVRQQYQEGRLFSVDINKNKTHKP